MKLPSRMSIVALCAVALLLAACNQPTAKAPPTGFITLSLKLEGATLNNSGALQPLGIPNDPENGDNALDSVRVTVRDANDDPVYFSNEAGTYVAKESGQDHLMLDANGSAEVSLPSHLEPYTFEARGSDSSGNVIAYHSTTPQEISDTPTVQIALESVLGDAVMVPRLPTNIIAPGAILDLMLVVMANGNDEYPADYLQAPLGDYTVTYDLDHATDVTLLSESNRGIRLSIGDYCPDILVSGTVEGYRESGGAIQEASAPFTLLNAPECLAGTLEADTVNPEVTLSYDMDTRVATGTANDNYQVERVEIYDGPVLVATTDPDIFDDNPDVAEIKFVGTEYSATLTVNPVAGLQAIAYDDAGNQATSAPTTVEVETGDSIQDALDTVAPGGVVKLPVGTFGGALEISSNVTIVGDPSGGTIITPAGITSSGLNFALQSTSDERRDKAILEITGADIVVKISNVTIMGDGGNNCADYFAGIRVSYGATLHLTNSEVTGIADGYASCGVGIQVGRNITTETHSYNEQYSGTAHLTNVTLSNFGKTAILIEHPDSMAYINGGEITGLGETDRGAQNGVQISRGGNAEVRNMTIKDVDFYRATGSDDTAAGILLFEPGKHVILQGNTIRDSGNGVTVLRQATGGSLTISGNVFENNRTHVENANPQELDVSDNTFDGLKPSEMTLQELLDLEDKIEHVLDHQEPLSGWWKPQPEDYGLVRTVPGNLYVTTNSGSIQRAVDAADPGDTLNIEPDADFTHEDRLIIEKDLTIFGNNATARHGTISGNVNIDGLNWVFN